MCKKLNQQYIQKSPEQGRQGARALTVLVVSAPTQPIQTFQLCPQHGEVLQRPASQPSSDSGVMNQGQN